MTPALAALPAPSLWWIDAAAAIVLAVSLVFGAFNGLSGEAARLVAFAVALVVASLVFSAVRDEFFPGDGTAGRVLSLAGAIAVAACVCIVLGRLLRRFLRAAIPQPFDALLGAALRGATACVVLLAFFAVIRVIPYGPLQDAVFSRTVSGRMAASVLATAGLNGAPAAEGEAPAPDAEPAQEAKPAQEAEP